MVERLINNKMRPFLSIRWKLFLVVSCLLVLVHLVFTVIFINYLNQHEKDERFITKQQLITQLDRSISLEYEVLQSKANTLLGDTLVSATPFTDEVVQQLSYKFDRLAQTAELDNLTLLTHGQIIAQSGSVNQIPQSILLRALETNTSISGTYCDIVCSLYVVQPSVVINNRPIAILVQRNLSSIVSAFNRRTSVDIGAFKAIAHSADFNEWNKQGYSFSHPDLTIPVLVRLLAKEGTLSLQGEYQVKAFGREIDVNFFSAFLGTHEPLNWVILEDKTQAKKLLNACLQALLLSVLASFFVSLLLTLLIVNRFSLQFPRILSSSESIDLGPTADGTVNYRQNTKILDDELQQHDRQLAQIRHKMDQLKQAETSNAIKLQSMMRELNQAKNFIERLMHNDETAILVQQLGGEVIAMNQPGCALFEVEDYSGMTYAEIFCSDRQEEDGLAALNYLYLGGETLVKAEAQWYNSKGELYVLLWVHSLLCVPGTIDPVILSVCVDITEQRKAEDRLEWLAFNDPNQTHGNKQLFLEALPFAVSRSLERHKILALLYCEVTELPVDIANSPMLKEAVIEQFKERLSTSLRQYDMLTPLSDEHFVIVLEGLNDKFDAKMVTDKIFSSFNESFEVEQVSYTFEVIIGASYAPEHSDSVPQLLRNAEMAMFQAKREGVGFLEAKVE